MKCSKAAANGEARFPLGHLNTEPAGTKFHSPQTPQQYSFSFGRFSLQVKQKARRVCVEEKATVAGRATEGKPSSGCKYTARKGNQDK